MAEMKRLGKMMSQSLGSDSESNYSEPSDQDEQDLNEDDKQKKLGAKLTDMFSNNPDSDNSQSPGYLDKLKAMMGGPATNTNGLNSLQTMDDRIKMQNPNLQGPRLPFSVPTPDEEAQAKQALGMASAGSLGSGGNKSDMAQRLQNLGQSPSVPRITADKISGADQLLQEIMQRPSISNDAKMRALKQFNSALEKGKRYGVVD